MATVSDIKTLYKSVVDKVAKITELLSEAEREMSDFMPNPDNLSMLANVFQQVDDSAVELNKASKKLNEQFQDLE